MSREKSVLKNTLILMIGTFVPRMIGLLTTPILTGSLPTGSKGIIDFLNTVVLLFLVPLATLQLEQAFFRFLIDAKTETERKRIITSGSVFIIAVLLVIGFVTYWIPIEGFTGIYKWLFILYIWVEVISQIIKFILRAFSMYKVYSIMATIAVIVNFGVLVVFLMYLKMGYQGMFLALLLADVVAVLFALVFSPVLRYFRLSYFDSDMMKRMIAFGLPFIPNALSFSINDLADSVILRTVLGNDAVGLYATSAKIPNIVSIIYPAFNLAWTESATRSVGDQDSSKYYSKMFKMIFRVLSGGTSALLAISPYLYYFLVADKEVYAGAEIYVPTLIVATYFLCVAQFLASIYIAKKLSKNMSITTVLSGVVNIVVNISLIWFIGIQAAAISTFVSNLLLVLYRYYDLNKNHCRIRISKRLVLLTAIIMGTQMYLYWLYSPIGNAINAVIGVIFAYFICGDLIIDMLKGLLRRGK